MTKITIKNMAQFKEVQNGRDLAKPEGFKEKAWLKTSQLCQGLSVLSIAAPYVTGLVAGAVYGFKAGIVVGAILASVCGPVGPLVFVVTFILLLLGGIMVGGFAGLVVGVFPKTFFDSLEVKCLKHIPVHESQLQEGGNLCNRSNFVTEREWITIESTRLDEHATLLTTG